MGIFFNWKKNRQGSTDETEVMSAKHTYPFYIKAPMIIIGIYLFFYILSLLMSQIMPAKFLNAACRMFLFVFTPKGYQFNRLIHIIYFVSGVKLEKIQEWIWIYFDYVVFLHNKLRYRIKK